MGLEKVANSIPLTADTSTSEGAFITVSADVEVFVHLSPAAKTELQTKLTEAAAMVLKEALSLESTQREKGAKPDIGRWHIERSWWSMMLRYSSERHSKLLRLLPLLSSVCIFFMGFAASHLKDWWGVPLFVVGTILAAICIASIYVFAGRS